MILMRSEPGAIDTSDILSVCRNGGSLNRALLKEILGYFVAENRHRIEQANRAARAADRETLCQVAHAVKGSAALVGAGRLHDLARAIEYDALPGELRALSAAVAALKDEFSAVLQSLRSCHPDALSD